MSGNDSSKNDQSRLLPSKRSLEVSDEIIETCKMGKTAAAGIGPAVESLRQNEDFLSTPEGLPFTKNREFFLAALLDQHSGTTSRTIFPRMSPELLNQKDLLLLAIDLKRREDILLQHVSEDMQNDQDVVHKAVVKNGQELQFASTALKENKEFIVDLLRVAEYVEAKHIVQHMCATLWEDDDFLQGAWDLLAFQSLLDIIITFSPELSKIAWLKIVDLAPYVIYQLPKTLEMDVDLLAQVPVEVLAEDLSDFPNRVPSSLPHHYKDLTIIKQAIAESWNLNEEVTVFPKKGEEEDDLEFVKAVAESENNDHLVHPDMDGVSSRIQTILHLEQDPSIFHHLDEALRDDIEVVDTACENQSDNFRHASERVQTLYQLREDPARFATLGEEFRGEPDLAKIAVMECPTMIAHVKHELLADKEFFWSILKDRPGLYSCAPSTLKSDRYFNFRSVCLNPSVFLLLPQSVRKDKAILRSIRGRKPIQAEEVAKHVVPEFWTDERFMEQILCSMPSILEFLPHECRSNKNLVMLGGTKTITLANPVLWDDHDFVRKIADKYPKELRCAPDHVLQDRYVLIRFACEDPKNVLQSPVAGPSLADRSFVDELLAESPEALQFLPEKWKEDKDLIRRCPETFRYASHNLKSDKALMLSLLKAQANARVYANMNFRHAGSSVWDDASFVKCLVEVTESAEVFGFMSNSQRIALFADRTFALFASESCKRDDLFTHLPSNLRNDLEVMTKVLSNHAYSGSLSHDLLSQTGLAVVNNVGFFAECIGQLSQLSNFDWNNIWKYMGSNLKAQIKSSSHGLLRYRQMKPGSQKDPLPHIWFPSLNRVQRFADTHLRSFSFEIFWAQSDALEELPAEVISIIHSFLGKNGTANRAFVESQQEAAQALEYCGPIYVALKEKGIYWRSLL